MLLDREKKVRMIVYISQPRLPRRVHTRLAHPPRMAPPPVPSYRDLLAGPMGPQSQASLKVVHGTGPIGIPCAPGLPLG